MSRTSESGTSRARAQLVLLAVAALVALLGARPAAAQDPDEEARMERIASTYRLTEAGLRKYTAAMRELGELARSQPSILKSGDTTRPALHPAVRAALARAGLSWDEFEKFGVALAYAHMANLGASMSGGAARDLEKAPPVARANVAFVKSHEAELKALMTEASAMEPGAGGEKERASELKVTGSMRAGVNSEIELDVIGGARAGHYTANVTEGGCSSGLVKSGAWGNQYSITTQDPKKFSSLQLIVPDAEAAASGTTEFLMTVTFGPLLAASGTNYEIDTRRESTSRGQGQGTLELEDSGAGATVTFDAKTKEGVGLKGTIKCYTVMRVS